MTQNNLTLAVRSATSVTVGWRASQLLSATLTWSAGLLPLTEYVLTCSPATKAPSGPTLSSLLAPPSIDIDERHPSGDRAVNVGRAGQQEKVTGDVAEGSGRRWGRPPVRGRAG